MTSPDSLTELLERVRPEAEADKVSVREILNRIGEDSFAPIVLVPALLLVSPLSGIPGTPTIGALIVVTITVQWLFGRRHLWLPDFLMVRELSAARLSAALTYLQRPAAWFDRHSRDRFLLLVQSPLALIPKLCVLGIAMTWPLLELLPLVTSIGAGAVSLFAFGLMMRDGIYIVAGYGAIGVVVSLIYWLSSAT